MSFIEKYLGIVYIRKDNFQRIPEEEIEALKSRDLIIKRSAKGIVIYSEIDFSEFYRKHCERTPNDNNPFTVIVYKEDLNKIPEKDITIESLKRALKYGKKERDVIIEEVRGFLGVEWFNEKPNSKPFEVVFRFRDIKEITPKEIENLGKEGKLTHGDCAKLQTIFKSSFTPECDYIIDYIWLIGHTDIVQKPRKNPLSRFFRRR